MCDSATRSVIEQVVRRRISLGNDYMCCPTVPMHKDAMFTALDISREVQQVHQVRERHRDMKYVVHEMFDNGLLTGYQRKLVAVAPGLPEAWVYYPNIADPDTYGSNSDPSVVANTAPRNTLTPLLISGVPGTGKGFSATAQVVNYQKYGARYPLSVPATVPQSPVPATGISKVDSRGRVNIPAHLIASLGLKPTDWVFALPDASNRQVVISAQLDPSNWPAAYRYRVDKSGNVRVSSSCLTEGNCVNYYLAVDWINDTIVIKGGTWNHIPTLVK